jgi:transcriptional regulator with XRE-family HTH domain
MATRQRPIDRGRERAGRLLVELGRELRDARVAAGLGQRAVAAAAGTDAAQISRLERARMPDASLRSFCVPFAVLGLRLSARAYPEGDPIRDAAHARLLERSERSCRPR